MGRCLLAPIVSTTRPSVSSHRWRRKGPLQKGVFVPATVALSGRHTKADDRAKYIEGLENRLGRMESLLKLSGLLSEEDDRTDLGTLEKRLADKTHNMSNGATPKSAESTPHPSASSDSRHNTPQQERRASSRSSVASPNPEKRNEEEVEALSDMMCSLVTNNHGETRYIGMSSSLMSTVLKPDSVQGLPLGFQYFRPRVYSGSTKRRGTVPFKT